jgi:nucleotide-binding universal stress UspA family protein
MKTIIAPVDFSAVSDNASLYAAKLAADVNANLILLHAMELPIAVAEFPVTEDLFDEIGMEKELEALKNKLNIATNNKVNIKTKNILSSPEYEIKELCKTTNPFAVVMGTHSYAALDRFFLGSTTVYSAQHLHYPVIVVPAGVQYKPIKNIALASDLKDIYEAPIAEIEMIVKLFNAKFEVLYAAKNENVINKNAVNTLLLDHRLLDLNPEFHFVENKDIMQGITSVAKEHAVDLLIIIPKKHGPFHKSQAKEFVFYSDIPVMAVHEKDAAQQS